MNIIIYAPGGGGGHFNRSLALLAHFFDNISSCLLVHSSPLYLAVKELLQISKVELIFEASSERRVELLKSRIHKYDMLIVDTFLYGPYNELHDYFFSIPTIFIYRSSNQTNANIINQKIITHDTVLSLIPTLSDIVLTPYLLNTIYVGNIILTPEKWSILGITLPLSHGIENKNSVLPNSHKNGKEINLKVSLIHLGPKEELDYLIAEANNLKRALTFELRIYSRTNPVYPGFLAIINTDLIICGGGYNILAEIIEFRKRAITIPFIRDHDDQFQRIISYKNKYPEYISYSSEMFLDQRHAS